LDERLRIERAVEHGRALGCEVDGGVFDSRDAAKRTRDVDGAGCTGHPADLQLGKAHSTLLNTAASEKILCKTKLKDFQMWNKMKRMPPFSDKINSITLSFAAECDHL
jgi:hypothetical protein